MRCLSIALCSAQILLLGATRMSAQDLSYDQNALRVESHLGDLQIVRGKDGTVVARAGVFRGPRVAGLFNASEPATAEAKVFERDYNPGAYIAAAGIATLGAAIGASSIPDINNGIPSGLTAAGVLMIAYGGTKLERAYRALSRAIWWYNRDLKRQ